jgi:hypothetical protein
MLTREQECDRILRVCGAENYEGIFKALDTQFRIIHNRAQVLLAICGVLLSTSIVLMGSKIIGGIELRRSIGPLLMAAGAAEIACAAVVVGGVLTVRWMTEIPGNNARGWVMSSLRYRDRKTVAYRVAVALLLLSMILFQTAATLTWSHM